MCLKNLIKIWRLSQYIFIRNRVFRHIFIYKYSIICMCNFLLLFILYYKKKRKLLETYFSKVLKHLYNINFIFNLDLFDILTL